MSKFYSILVSSCLLGANCNYRGTHARCWQDGWLKLVRELSRASFRIIPVCPEQQGGLPTPRPPSELQAPADMILAGMGKVINVEGQDVTLPFVKGAQEAVHLAEMFEAKVAIFKQKSPSCGYRRIFDGKFEGKLIGGRGVAAEALFQNGIRLFDEETTYTLWQQTGGFEFLQPPL